LPDSEPGSKQAFISLADKPVNIVIRKHDLPGFSPEGPLGELFKIYESSHPQFGADWLNNLARTALDAQEHACVYTAVNGDGCMVAVPLRFAADGRSVHALANFYTTLYSPVADAGADDTLILLTAVFRELAATGSMAALTLAPMNPESNLYTVLPQALLAAGWRGIHTYFCFANWTHPITGEDWNAYLAGRSSRVRNTVQRRTRKFLDNGRGALTITRDGERLENAIEDFTDIYNRSWKREEPYPDFIPELLRLAADRGWLRLFGDYP